MRPTLRPTLATLLLKEYAWDAKGGLMLYIGTLATCLVIVIACLAVVMTAAHGRKR